MAWYVSEKSQPIFVPFIVSALVIVRCMFLQSLSTQVLI